MLHKIVSVPAETAKIIAHALQSRDIKRAIHPWRIATGGAGWSAERPGYARLTNLFLEAMFRRADPLTEVVHYTSVNTLESMVSSNTIRLYTLAKRLCDDEYIDFALSHGLYIPANTPRHKLQHDAIYKDISSNIFYISFTQMGRHDEAVMWSEFGDKGKGVKISLRVNPMPEMKFRFVHYRGKERQLLQDVNRTLNSQGLPRFWPHGISWFASFWLPLRFKQEAEVRLMKTQYDRTKVLHDGKWNYIVVPLINGPASITKIEPGPNTSSHELRRRLAGTCVEAMIV